MVRLPALARRRTVWVPTLLGTCLLLATLAAPFLWWILAGENFLSANHGTRREIIIVEGWIGEEPIEAAGQEFARGEFHYVVAAGAYSGERWSSRRWSEAEIAQRYLLNSGVPPGKIIVAQSPESDAHRTFATAMAAKRALDDKGLTPKAVTVFTRDVHGRRSRMVFQKVFGPKVEVGVICWKPQETETGRWWRNSSRADEFMKETIGCVWEWVFDSGRSFHDKSK